MATEASGESFSSEERGAPVSSEPEVETGGDGAPLAAADRETSSGGPDEESSLDSDPVAPQGGTSAPTAQLTPDDDPDGETFEEALEGEDGFSDVSKPPALVANNGVTEGEPPSETRVLAAVEANSRHENLVKVSSDDPNTAESSQYEILAAEEKESVENPTLQSTEEKPIKDEAPAAEGVDGDEEHAVSDAQEEKDGSSVKESGESASPAMERVTESKTEKEGFQAAEEERDGAKADDVDDVKVGIAGSADPNQSVYLVGILAAEEKESVENSTLQSTKEKSIEDEAALPRGLDGDGDPAVPDGQEKNDGNLVEVSGESANPAIQGVVESKTDAAEEERDGAEADSMDEVETGIAGSADSDQYVCPVSISAAHTVDELCKLTNGINKEEKNKNLVRSYPNLDTKIADVSLQKLDGSNGKKSTADVGNTEKGDGSSESFEIKNGNSSENSADKVDIVNDGQTVYSMPSIQETGNETLTIESDRAANETEANNDEPVLELVPDGDNSISAQDKKSQSITAEESKGRETEEYKFGTSGVTDYVRLPNSVSELEPTLGEDFIDHVQNLDQENAEEEDKSLVSDGPARVAILASSATAKNMIKELEEGSSSTSTYSALDSSKDVDGQIVLDSDEEMATDEEDDGKEMIDSDALVALLRAASGSSTDGGISVTSQDAARIFSFDRPAGLGSAIPSLKPAPPRPARPNLLSPSELAVAAEPDNLLTEEQKKLHDKVELIRVKFLRLVHRLGHSPEDTVAAQVLYRLSLAEGIRSGRQTNRAFSLESAKKKALQLEQDGTEGLDFSCNILVLGKSGVGKSATINSIFGEEKSRTDAFEPATSSVKEIVGIVDGVKICVIDTPGLRASGMDQASSRRILTSIKKYTKRCPPDIVLYVDRMDTMTRDQNDLPLLRTITSTLGSSIWFNAIVALTHAASAPPDGPGGSPLSYEVFVAQRSHAVQQSIRLAAGDMRLMNPVALVENHPSCRRNREGQRVLPNGLTWRPQMLLLCYSSKILSEANSLLKLQDSSPGKLFGFRFRSPPLPFLLSSLLQSRAHPKLPTDQGGENEDSDMDLDDLSDAEQEEEDEYDQLPPFKPLKKSQIAKLTKEQRKAYFDEYDYRVKLLQKKQWREELRRLKAMKNRQKVFQDDFGHADTVEDFDQDNSPATVPVPLPDMVLPPSFDCDAPTYRYRFLESTSQFLSRPVMDTHGWDHDCGYDGVSLEESLAVAGRFPAVLSAQVTKDKKEFSIHLDSSISAKHGENGSTLAGFDIQAIGKQLAYILRGETKFKALKKNRTTGGISITFLGENVATGLKLEDQLSIGKQVNLVVSAGAVRAQGDTAYGANLEARLRDKDYPIGQALSTLGLSLMRWHGDLALGTNLQSQFAIGRNSKMAVRVALNNKLAGQITVRTSTSEQLQLALVGIIPIAISIFRSMRPDAGLG